MSPYYLTFKRLSLKWHKDHVGSVRCREENEASVLINELLKVLILVHGYTVRFWCTIYKSQQPLLWRREYVAFRNLLSIWGYGIELNLWELSCPKQMRKCIAWTWERKKEKISDWSQTLHSSQFLILLLWLKKARINKGFTGICKKICNRMCWIIYMQDVSL